MPLGQEDDGKIDRLIYEIHHLAYLIEGQANHRPKEPAWWNQATKTVGAFLLAVSLTLGVQHELMHSPAAHLSAPADVQQTTPMQRATVEQLLDDVARLGSWIKGPPSQEAVVEIADAISKDLQAIIKYPCAETVEAEAVELVLQFQLDSVQKVISSKRITSIEHRAKRLASLLQRLCA